MSCSIEIQRATVRELRTVEAALAADGTALERVICRRAQRDSDFAWSKDHHYFFTSIPLVARRDGEEPTLTFELDGPAEGHVSATHREWLNSAESLDHAWIPAPHSAAKITIEIRGALSPVHSDLGPSPDRD